jgi:hypothetical protein
MDIRASRCAIWKLHAPPSREADINPNPKKGGYPAPDRVTFLTGPNRDFPKWRRQDKTKGRDEATDFGFTYAASQRNGEHLRDAAFELAPER